MQSESTQLLTVGETMVLLNPHESGPLNHVVDFRKRIGGAESNVAIGLARLGHDATWVSRLGDRPLGRYVRDTIRGAGVRTQVTFDSEHPTGLMFKERRSEEPRVFYYRENAAASQLSPADLPSDLLKSARYLHVTGITPALSASCRELILDAVARANEYDVTVSFDPNLRFTLWDEDAMRETLHPLIAQCDIVLPGRTEGSVLVDRKDPEAIGERMRDLGASEIVVKLGAEGAYLTTDGVSEQVAGHEVETVDTVGAGDGFAAGYLSGRLDGLDPVDATRRANAVGALATTVTGDIEALPTRDELSQFLEGEPERNR